MTSYLTDPGIARAELPALSVVDVKSDRALRDMPVMVFSMSESELDIARCYESGAKIPSQQGEKPGRVYIDRRRSRTILV